MPLPCGRGIQSFVPQRLREHLLSGRRARVPHRPEGHRPIEFVVHVDDTTAGDRQFEPSLISTMS